MHTSQKFVQICKVKEHLIRIKLWNVFLKHFIFGLDLEFSEFERPYRVNFFFFFFFLLINFFSKKKKKTGDDFPYPYLSFFPLQSHSSPFLASWQALPYSFYFIIHLFKRRDPSCLFRIINPHFQLVDSFRHF